VDPGANRAAAAFPFSCVGGRGGSGLRGGPAGGGGGARGASAEFPLTLTCSHPPWGVQTHTNGNKWLVCS